MKNHVKILLTACWIAYACLHSIMAAVWFKRFMSSLMGRFYPYYRLLYSVVAAVTLIALLVFQFSGASPRLFASSGLLLFIGIVCGIAGLTVMLLCIKKYFINLSGVDVLLKKQSDPVLETRGLHLHVRHPLYSGTLLFVWSLFILSPLLSNLIACVIITLYTLAGIRMEEKKLVLEFGDAYKRYAADTPMLIPLFRKKRHHSAAS